MEDTATIHDVPALFTIGPIKRVQMSTPLRRAHISQRMIRHDFLIICLTECSSCLGVRGVERGLFYIYDTLCRMLSPQMLWKIFLLHLSVTDRATNIFFLIKYFFHEHPILAIP
ncbi:hypothetical protein DEJ73_00980 [Chromohalobacter salexigens]|nr:hypothetical protein [Chromohalobacter salexigens]